MKKFLLFMTAVLLTAVYGYSQAPGIFNYQGVARNSVGNVLVNKSITLRITIHDGAAAGPVVYQETRGATTNPFGLFNVQVGSPGAITTVGTIAGVPWGVGTKHIQVEIDPNGGSTFINIGTAQVASVPYALYSNIAGDLILPYNKTQADAGTLFKITNSGTGSGSTALEGLTNSTANNVSAIIGTVTPTGAGSSSTGVRGINNGTAGQGIGVWGSQNGSGWGVYGQTPGGRGVYGSTTTGTGVYGDASSGVGVYGISSTGRAGFFENTNAANAAATLFATSNGTGWTADFVSTNATTRALRTAGGLRFTGINEGLNRILASDAIGNALWQDPSAIGIVTGSGTLNFIPKWTPNGTTLGNSQMFDDGTNVGVGTITPFGKFNVNAGLQFLSANLQGSSTAGTWLSLGNTDPGGRWFNMVSTASGNGEGPGKLVFFQGGGPSLVTGSIMTFVHSSMNVGINTNNPLDKLHVNSGNSFATQTLQALDPTNAGPHLRFLSGGEFSYIDYIRTDYTGPGFGHRQGSMEFRGGTRLNFYPQNLIGINDLAMTIITNGNVGIGTATPGSKLHVQHSAATLSAVQVDKTDVNNASNAMNVISANATANFYSNSAVLGQRGVVSPNTYLWVGGAGGTAVTGISSTGIGMQGTSEGGFGVLGLSYNGIGVRGYNLNSGYAGYFQNDLNPGNTFPVVYVNSIATGGGVYGLQSNMVTTNPGGYSTALRGQHNSITGNGIGVWGSQNGGGWGVFGETPDGAGVFGNALNNGTGLVGQAVNGMGTFSRSNNWYGVWGETNSLNGTNNAGVLAYANNPGPSGFSRGLWAYNSATNNDGAAGLFTHVSGGYGIYTSAGANGWGTYSVAGTDGIGVFGESFGVNSRGIRGQSDVGIAGLFESTNTTSTQATVRVLDRNLTTSGGIFTKASVYAEMNPLAGATYMLNSPTAIKGVSTTSLTVGYGAGSGVQGVSRSGVGVVGNAFDGVGLLGIGWDFSTGYALQTFGRVMISGQGAALNNVLTSDAVGNATWQPLGAIAGVTGSGTNNFITKWTPSGSNIGISQLFDNGVSIGMGTTTPSAAVMIDIQSNFTQARFVDLDQASQVWISAPGLGYTGGIGTATAHDFPLFTNFLDRMTIKADGRVGINTVNPQGFTEIMGNSGVGFPHLTLNENSDDYGRLTLKNTNANNSGNNFWDIAGYTNDTRANERLNIYNNATGDLVSVTGDGRVGIGTFNPAMKTHINSGNSFFNLMLEAQDGVNAGPHQYLYSGGEFALIDYLRTDYTLDPWRRGALELRGVSRLNFFPTNLTTVNTGMTIVSNGNVGIGASTPIYQLDMRSTIPIISLFDSDQAAQLAVAAPGLGYTGGIGTVSNHDLAIFSANVDRITIRNTGLIGINNFTPASRMHLVEINGQGFRSDAGFAAPGFVPGNEFTTLNSEIGIVSRLNMSNTHFQHFFNTAVLGMDSTTNGLSFGLTGISLANTLQSGSGVYGIASIERNLTTDFTAFFGARFIGGQFWGGDYGVTGAVWDTPGAGLDGHSTTKVGVMGWVNYTHPGINIAIYGASVNGAATNYAGYFNGNVQINGNMTATGAKAFRVDHPLDPENKYLSHFAVESPEVQNVYNGNIKTDANGKATVTLPGYFESINKDFKYQLTVIDETQFAMARVSKRISGNSFELMTSVPGIEVSWQVTAIRNDRSIQKYVTQAETEKPAAEKGKYLDPELYGKSSEFGVGYVEPKTATSSNVKAMPVRTPATIPTERKMPTTEPTDADVNESLKQQEETIKNWPKPIEKPDAGKYDLNTGSENKKPVVLTEEMMRAQNIERKPMTIKEEKPVIINKVNEQSKTETPHPLQSHRVEMTAEELKQSQQQTDKNQANNKPGNEKPVQPETKKVNLQQEGKKPVNSPEMKVEGKVEKPTSQKDK